MSIIDHNHHAFKERWERNGANKYNGAYYYSQEIVNNIIPNVHTEKPWNWMTVSVPKIAEDRTVFFVHDNTGRLWRDFELFKTLNRVVFVCGLEKTVEKLKNQGYKEVIYLPLSVDVEYIKQFRAPKTKEAAFFGRKALLTKNTQYKNFPSNIDFIYGLPREDFLKKMAEYKKIYATGRCAIEAKVLGCEIGVFDSRFPDPNYWKILDNKVAAKILEKKLNQLDEEWKSK